MSGDTEFFHVLKKYGAPYETYMEFSDECKGLEFYRDIFKNYLDKIWTKMERLHYFAIDKYGGNDNGVLDIECFDFGESGRGAFAEGILYLGKEYTEKFINSSDLEAAVMLKYDKIPPVVFKDEIITNKNFYYYNTERSI